MNQTKCTSRPFLLNLPSEIIINILTRLPVRTILSCKCVCNQLLNLLSTPDFAASHLPLSTPALLFLQHGRNRNLCQIFEFDDGFELQHDNLNFGPVMKSLLNVSLGLPDVDLQIVGSVDGLLCLREHGNKVYDALYICNLITREYIALPKIEAVDYKWCSEYGFGVSKISGQYKVVRKVHKVTRGKAWRVRYNRCLVYTVGTRAWRNIKPDPPFGQYHSFSLFLNGNLHGSVHKYYDSDIMKVSCFDLESELFKPFPIPPSPDSPIVRNLGILDDCLCFFSRLEFDVFSSIWVMKEYGVEKSWTQLVVINDHEDEESGFSCTEYDSIWPIKTFKNGDILLNKNNCQLFCFSSTTKTCRNVDLMIQKGLEWFDAVPHTLSFLSLKSFDGENVIPFS